MKPTLVLTIAFLLLSICTRAMPLGPLSAEVSLPDSVRSFESAITQLDEKYQVAAKEKQKFEKHEKWITAGVAALTAVAVGGYTVSAAIPMAINHHQAKKVAELQAAVAKANAAATVQGRSLVKRAGEKAVEGMAELGSQLGEDDESFWSAFSRSSSQRMSDFDDAKSGLVKSEEPRTPSHVGLRRTNSFPTYFSAAQSQGRSPDVAAPMSLQHSDSAGEMMGTHERLAAVEATLLDIRKHQHDQQKLSPFTKLMVILGLINAAGTVVPAEMNIQNAIEANQMSKKAKLPDVSNLDPTTCARFAAELSQLDCSTAHGKPLP